MLIGADYNKVHIDFYGYHLVEPNVFLTDAVMSGISLFIAFSIYSMKEKNEFKRYWFLFFFVYGISSFAGGLGHLLYLYFGVAGKMFTWITGILSIYYIERAMVSVIQEIRLKALLNRLVFSKLLFVFAIFSLVCLTQPISQKPALGFLPVAINTIIGVSLSAGILGYRFKKTINDSFKYFYIGVLIMVPSAIFFLGKINPHQWFDKNDISHVLLTIGIIYFYIGIKKTVGLIKS
jgi:hypothetical protein